jgi:hypothetical protein
MTDAWEIVEDEVSGVRMKVFRHQPTSLRQIWDMSAAHGDAVYLVYEDQRITFAEAHAMVRALANRLVTAHGVQQGDRVAIAARNFPEWAIAYWATVTIGAVAVPLNAWWTGTELAYGLADSGAVVLVADDERAERIEPLLAETQVRAVILIRSDRRLPGSERFEDAVAGSDPPLPDVHIAPDDDATIMYTSGTTGRPKGAVQTHRNFGAYLMNGAYLAAQTATGTPPPTMPPRPPATLLTLPLFHVGGLQSFLLPFTQWRQGRPDVQVGRRSRCRPDRARGGHDDRRCPDDGVPAVGGGSGEGAAALVADGDLLRRHARSARARPPHRPADRVSRGTRQRLRVDGDLRRGDRQLRRGVRRPPGQRRAADLTRHRGTHRGRRWAAAASRTGR